MKICTLFILIIGFSCKMAAGQYKERKKDAAYISKIKTKYLTLGIDSKSTERRTFSFEKISFADVRTDTSSIGNYGQLIQWLTIFSIGQNSMISLSGGLAHSLTGYCNNHYSQSLTKNNTEIVCYIKKFRVRGKDTLTSFPQFQGDQNLEIRSEIECYYRKNGYQYPATRIDTSLFETSTGDTSAVYRLTKKLMDCLADKWAKANEATIFNRKAYTDEDINKRYSKNEIRILTDTIYRRGVYKNMLEFRANRPSIDSFSLETGKKNTVFLFDSNGDIINTLAPGVIICSDKKNFSFLYANKLIPLIKKEKGFHLIVPVWQENVQFTHLFSLQMDEDEFMLN
ncbi:hypothetical protein QTN47_09705 [Danxiaibacter flavus]|uniref:Uncharacterized protein n=1 Tax=Danxiaibacter flavus TaxID=3049108 RepID=A0ABV3ZGZ0_9BACT|nr:hypothetical protein QNM32_09705 [Chitinophagaceae bacterium DXS]